MLGRALTGVIDHDFCRWLRLTRYEVPRMLADGTTWHGFRPEGATFRDAVTLNLEVNGEGRIADAKLCIARGFIEHPKDGAFARDVTAGFLRWIMPEVAREAVDLDGFLRELGDLGPNVIRLPAAGGPTRPRDSSAFYRVYLGDLKDSELAFGGGVCLRLTNLQARDGPRDPQHDWIWIRAWMKSPGSD